DRFIELLRFVRLSGARTCEAGRLRWSHINIEAAEIVLQRHKTSSTQRTPKPRVSSLHALVMKLLISIRERNEPGPHVFHRSPERREEGVFDARAIISDLLSNALNVFRPLEGTVTIQVSRDQI